MHDDGFHNHVGYLHIYRASYLFITLTFATWMLLFQLGISFERDEATLLNACKPFWPYQVACRVCTWARPGVKPILPAVEAWSLNYWTSREVPTYFKFKFLKKDKLLLFLKVKIKACTIPTFDQMVILSSFLSISFSFESNIGTSLYTLTCLLFQKLRKMHFTQTAEPQKSK